VSDPNDDLFGGMFDINGDGKIDIVEKSLEYHYLEESAKSLEGSSGDSGDGWTSYRRTSGGRTTGPARPSEMPVSEEVTRLQYESRIADFVRACVSALFTFLLLSVLACVVMWAAADTYEPGNGASAFVTGTVFLLGGGFILALLIGAAEVIGDSWKHMKKTKELWESGTKSKGEDRTP